MASDPTLPVEAQTAELTRHALDGLATVEGLLRASLAFGGDSRCLTEALIWLAGVTDNTEQALSWQVNRVH